MHRIGSVGSRSFITRMLATASLLALYVLGTGALTLAGAGSARRSPTIIAIAVLASTRAVGEPLAALR